MLTVEEHGLVGYQPRTIQNAQEADYTIALAFDHNTAGERLTKRSSKLGQYQAVHVTPNTITTLSHDHLLLIEDLIVRFNHLLVKTVNIAGNSLQRVLSFGVDQKFCDDFTYEFLRTLIESPLLNAKPTLIRSGGQTGFDEAGIKAALRLNIDALALLPRHYLMRDATGADRIQTKNDTLARMMPIQQQ